MNATATRIRKTAAATAPKGKGTPKVDPYASVKDDHATESGAIAYRILSADRAYFERVAVDGPILAARVHAGESQADIARAMCEAAKTDGRVVSLAAAKMRVSRYVRIGAEIVKGKPKNAADMEAIIVKASKDVRKSGGNKSGGNKSGGSKPKTPATVIVAATGTLDALVALVTEKGTAADRDALVALAENFLRKARAAQSLPVAQAS